MDQPLLSSSRSNRAESADSPEASEFDIREYLSLLKRHWFTIVAAGLLGLGWGAVRYFNTPETFQATTRVHIQRRVPSPLGGQSLWLESAWNPEFYPTQYEILKGQGLAMKVVELLRLWADPKFESLVSRSSFSNESGNTAEEDEQLKAQLAATIRGGVEIRPVRGTQLVDIVYRYNDPKIAARLANGYAQAFIAQGRDDTRSAVDSLTTRIQDEIADLERAILQDERELYALSESADLVGTPSSESEANQVRIAAATEQLSTAQQKRISAQSEYNSRRNQPPEVIAEIFAAGEYLAARRPLTELEDDYRSRQDRYQPTAPIMVELEQKLENERRRFESTIQALASRAINEAQTEYQRALREEQALSGQLRRLRDDVRGSQEEVNQANNLRDQIETRRATLTRLRTNFQEAAVVSGGGDSSISQIAEAVVPRTPISPNLRRDLTSGFILGLLLGAGVVILIELLDRSVKSPTELERRLQLPVLAVIPDTSTRSRYRRSYGYGYGGKRSDSTSSRTRTKGADEIKVDLVPHLHPRLAASEAYRGLRTALLLSSADVINVVAVTSAFPAEGKTATAVNLAVVLAQLGKKTLLVDGDLRKPRIHEVIEVSNRHGLVNYLVGTTPIENVVRPTTIENLFVASAGPNPPNPSELLSSARMRHFLAEARDAFDFVVLDTPPVLAVTDATILGSMSDGTVITVRAGRTSRDDVRACKMRLAFGGVKILGTVLNAYRPSMNRYERGYNAYHYQTYGHERALEESTHQDEVA